MGLLARGHVVGTVFLDLKKAVDTVDHSVLLAKVKHFKMSTE